MASASCPSSQAPALAAGPRRRNAPARGPPGAGPWAVHSSCSAESPSSRSRSANEMWAQALTGFPARLGQQPRWPLAASSPRAGASWYRWSLGPVIVFAGRGGTGRPAPARPSPRKSGVRSPWITPGAAEGGGQLHAPVLEVPGRGPGRAARTGPAGTSSANSAAKFPPGPSPAAAAAIRTSSAVRPGTSRAILPVHRQISRPTGSVDLPCGQRGEHPRVGWRRGRPRRHARRAAPRVIRVW